MKNKKMLTTLLAAFVIAGGGYGHSKSKALDKNFNTIKDTSGKFERIGGSNRYETSMMIAKRLNSKKAYVVNGLSFADVLSIGPVAASTKSPIILATDPDDMNKKLKSLGIENVTIVGGESSVSKDLFDSLKKNFSVNRVAGKDRYDTSEKIVRAYGGKNIGIATGKNFPDALSASPFLAKKNMMLLLVRGKSENEVPKDLNALYTFGGENSVKYTLGKRIDGSDRYQTSEKIAEEMGVSEGLILSSESKFTDSLSVSPLAYSIDAPILLTDKDGKALSEKAKSMIESAKKVIMVGGEDSLSKRLELSVKHRFDNKKVEEELKKLEGNKASDQTITMDNKNKNTGSSSTSSSSGSSSNSGGSSSNAGGSSSSGSNSNSDKNNNENTENNANPSDSSKETDKDKSINDGEKARLDISKIKSIALKNRDGNPVNSLAYYEGDNPIPVLDDVDNPMYIHIVDTDGKEYKLIKYSETDNDEGKNISYQFEKEEKRTDSDLSIAFEFDTKSESKTATDSTRSLKITIGNASTTIPVNIEGTDDEDENTDHNSTNDNALNGEDEHKSNGEDNEHNGDENSSKSENEDKDDQESSKSEIEDEDDQKSDKSKNEDEKNDGDEDEVEQEFDIENLKSISFVKDDSHQSDEVSGYVGDEKGSLKSSLFEIGKIILTDNNDVEKEIDNGKNEDLFDKLSIIAASSEDSNSSSVSSNIGDNLAPNVVSFKISNGSIESDNIPVKISVDLYKDGTDSEKPLVIGERYQDIDDYDALFPESEADDYEYQINGNGSLLSRDDLLEKTISPSDVVYDNGEYRVNIVKVRKTFDADNVTSLEITNTPSNTDFFSGDAFDKNTLRGLLITATDKNRKIKEYRIDSEDFSSIQKSSNSALAGNNTLRFTLGNASVNFSYTAFDKNNIRSMEITSNPSISTYTEGEKFSPNDMTISLTDSNGVIRNVRYGQDGAEFNKYGITYSPNKALTTDDTTITFRAGEASTTQDITVNERAFDKNNIVSMVVHTQPTKTEYNVGEKFDTTGMELELTYKNGTKKIIGTDEFGSYFIRHNSNSAFSESDLGGSESNKKTITFDFASGFDASTTLEVTVNRAHSEGEPTSSEDEYNHENFDRFELINAPTKTVYTEGEDFDPAGMVIRLYDTDGNSKDITSDDFARYDIEIENGQNLRQGNPIKAYFSNTYGITQTENITGITINSASDEETEESQTFTMPVTGDFYDFESSTNVSLLDTDVFKIDAKNSSSEKLSDWYNSLKKPSARIRIEKIGDFSSSPIELTYASSKDDFGSRKFYVNGSTIYIDRNFYNESGLNSDRHSISIDNGNGVVVNLRTNEGSITVEESSHSDSTPNVENEEDLKDIPDNLSYDVKKYPRISNRFSYMTPKGYIDLAESDENIDIKTSNNEKISRSEDMENMDMNTFHFYKGSSRSELFINVPDGTTVNIKMKGYKVLKLRYEGENFIKVD